MKPIVLIYSFVMNERSGNIPKLTRRQRTALEREQRATTPTPPIQPKGRNRFFKRVALFATGALLITGIGGGLYYKDQTTPYTVSETDILPLFNSATENHSFLFDQREKDLWDKAENDASSLDEKDLNSFNDLKLNIVRETMEKSHNPMFKASIDRISELIESSTLTIVILPDIPYSTDRFYSAMLTAADIGKNNELTLGLQIPFPVLKEASPLKIANQLVHEEKHMTQYQELDNTNRGQTANDRRKAIRESNRTREKFLRVEAEAYGAQMQASIIANIQTRARFQTMQDFYMMAHFIKGGEDWRNPKFQAFLAQNRLVNLPIK